MGCLPLDFCLQSFTTIRHSSAMPDFMLSRLHCLGLPVYQDSN